MDLLLRHVSQPQSISTSFHSILSKESRQALTIPSWLPPGEDIPSIKATEVKPSPVEGWPDTQHVHFTHPAGQAPDFSGHTPPAECTGPSGFPTLTAEAVKVGEFPPSWKIFYCIIKIHKMQKFSLTDDRIFITGSYTLGWWLGVGQGFESLVFWLVWGCLLLFLRLGREGFLFLFSFFF